jgi:hypothetical protein
MELNVSYIHNDLCVELEDDLRDFLAEPGFKEIDSGYDFDSGESELIFENEDEFITTPFEDDEAKDE